MVLHDVDVLVADDKGGERKPRACYPAAMTASLHDVWQTVLSVCVCTVLSPALFNPKTSSLIHKRHPYT